MDENNERQRELRDIGLAIKAAMRAQELTNQAVGDHAGVHASMVSQWTTGRKPVAAGHAPKLASLLRLDPAAISPDYRDQQRTHAAVVLREHTGENVAQYAARDSMPPDADLIQSADWARGSTPEIRLAQVEAQVYALNLALGLMVGVMREHRPIEADAVADAIERKIPLWMREGVLQELTEALRRH